MTTENNEDVTDLLTDFEEKYHKVLRKLDSLSRGTFDEDDATAMAAACLIAQAALLADLAAADLRSRAMKRDIDFAKAKAYSRLKHEKGPDGKKVTESALAHLILQDEDVQKISVEQSSAEKDYKNLSNIHALLKEAHLTFRSMKKAI